MENNHLLVGGIYEYQLRVGEPFLWAYHDDDQNYPDDAIYTYPYQETYVVLDIADSAAARGLFSVKVLSSAGTVGRLHINPDDWKRLNQ